MKPALRIIFFNPWASSVIETNSYLDTLPHESLAAHLPSHADERLKQMARLDRDWYGECARCFNALTVPAFDMQPSWVVGPAGLSALAERATKRDADENWWFIFMGHHPEKVGPALGPLCAFLKKAGVRIAYYAFDEASRAMPCFSVIAPHLDVFIHDEEPLGPAAVGLRGDCINIHRSWVANVVPFSVPFNEAPENKIVFLGSQLGLTPHRQRQIDFLHSVFKDKFIAHHDHSVSVMGREQLNRYAVGFCPEGRKFTTTAMARTHTDRPFWSGCLGLVPVSENSIMGGRLDELAEKHFIVRYPHADLVMLQAACERALAMTVDERRRIYDYFNQHETVGIVLADALAEAYSCV